MKRKMLVPLLCAALSACAEQAQQPSGEPAAGKVATSGKTDVLLAQVPPQVLAAAKAARPGFVPAEAEAETRDGRRYFDVAGRLADGSEVEFDIMEQDGSWKVVETQRDIQFAAAPPSVRKAATEQDAKLAPTRVIESTQSDGVVIYELYAPKNGNRQGRKVEVKLAGGKAEVLSQEWAH